MHQYQEIRQEEENVTKLAKHKQMNCMPKRWRIRNQILLVQAAFCLLIVIVILMLFLANFIMLLNNFQESNSELTI